MRQANSGLAAARNTGLAAATSPFVAFLDADDRLTPTAVEAGLAAMATYPNAVMVYGAHRRIGADGARISRDRFNPVGPDPHTDLLRGNMVAMHAAVFYRAEALRRAGGFDARLRLCEDYDLYLRLSRDQLIACHPVVVAEYRWHGSNISSDKLRMLRAVLTVHDRYAASPDPARRAAWHEGQPIWRDYYASEIALAALRDWRSSRRPRALVAGAAGAARASPRWVAAAGLRAARRLLGQPPGVGSPPRPGSVRLGDLGGTEPISRDFGFDRGTPIDRYYIEAFLQRHRDDVHGHVLEIGDDAYSRRFGGDRIVRQDILHVHAGNPLATLVGELADPEVVTDDVYDCMIITQTLHLVWDFRAAVERLRAALKPGGVALVTVPGISQIDRGEWGVTWYWSFTHASMARLFGEVFGPPNVHVEHHGNVFAATAFLQGLAVEEVGAGKLDAVDGAYQAVITIRAVKTV